MSKFLDEDSFSNVKGISVLDIQKRWAVEEDRPKIIIIAVVVLAVIIGLIVGLVFLIRHLSSSDESSNGDKPGEETGGNENKEFGGMLPRHKHFVDPIGTYSTQNVSKITNDTLAATNAGFRDDLGDMIGRSTHRPSSVSSFRSSRRRRPRAKAMISGPAGRRTGSGLYEALEDPTSSITPTIM